MIESAASRGTAVAAGRCWSGVSQRTADISHHCQRFGGPSHLGCVGLLTKQKVFQTFDYLTIKPVGHMFSECTCEGDCDCADL